MDSGRALTVSELNRCVREVIDAAFGEISVEGEVSNLRRQQSGHQYFTLKDDGAQLSCVWFARGPWRRGLELQDGMQVRLRGRLTVYEVRGQYQLSVTAAEPAGQGLLQARFEAMKRKLEAEGLFRLERKRELPRFPMMVALITSPSGAVLHDMATIFGRRAPWIRLVVLPVRVQGAGAAAEIASAVAQANELVEQGVLPIEVIVVARGGGSAEDLWEFNEESVARAVFASPLPVVSAVGHETDFTICDFVADVRAATPSAAAEILACDGRELRRALQQLDERLVWLTRGVLDRKAQQVDDLATELSRALATRRQVLRLRIDAYAGMMRRFRPDHVLALVRERHSRLAATLQDRVRGSLEKRGRALQASAERLRLLSPEGTLQRGYSITTNAAGEILLDESAVKPGDTLATRLASGSVRSRVE